MTTRNDIGIDFTKMRTEKLVSLRDRIFDAKCRASEEMRKVSRVDDEITAILTRRNYTRYIYYNGFGRFIGMVFEVIAYILLMFVGVAAAIWIVKSVVDGFNLFGREIATVLEITLLFLPGCLANGDIDRAQQSETTRDVKTSLTSIMIGLSYLTSTLIAICYQRPHDWAIIAFGWILTVGIPNWIIGNAVAGRVVILPDPDPTTDEDESDSDSNKED